MTGQELKYLDVVFNLSLNKSLEYKISGPLAKKARPGARVIVPLGFKKELGIIIKIKDKNDFEKPKEIYDLIDYVPIIPKELLKLTIWLGNYYISPPGKAVFLALPPGYKKLPALQYYVNPNADENIIKSLSKAPLQKRIFEDISERKSTSKIYLKRKFKHHSISTALKGLINKNLVLVKTKEMKKTFKPPVKLFVNLNSESNPDEKLLKRKTVQRVIEYIKEIKIFVDSGVLIKETKITRQLVNQLVKEKVLVQIEVDDFKEPFIDPEFITIPDFKLNKIQSKHLKEMLKAIDEEKFRTFLLFGVTGSGKTEIYIKAIEEALSRGKTAICLVPEITLTPQVAGLFRARFGKRVGIFHSRLTMLERMSIYSQVLDGELDVIIGPRSAIFVPIKNLGVIVVDEEQDQAYKQIELEPHYNGRDSAVYRAFLNDCVCILSSATPAMESMYNAVTGKYKLLEMQFRVEGRALPDKKIVDMRDVKNRGRNFSKELEEEIKKRLSEKEQILLFLNRRGFSRVLQCRKCGFVFECENCSVSLVYHLETHSLNCHYCEYMKKLPEACPECHSVDLKFIGSGTEKIQEELKELFPDARIGRLDRDIAIKRKKFQKVLADFKSHKIDILIGTQLIAKGLDFLNVTLVGVINSDILISFPDYRALEQAFQLLTQVSGRAGRGEKRGEVLIQTYQPDNEAIQYAIKNSYNEFFEFELPKREELSYPPFSHLIKFLFKAVSKDNARKYAYLYMNELVKIKEKYGFTLLGPAPGLIERIKNKYRWLLVVRSKKRGILIKVIKSIHQRLKPLAGRHKVSVDLIVDPYDLV